jgi:hypothetical protein
MQSKSPMHLSKRCGARTRRGSRCRSPAMPNGRCRMHGGLSPGAPRGNGIAHALLHQASRRKDEAGRIIATIDDYVAVRELIADLVAEGVDATVKPETREVVKAIARLLGEGRDEVRQADLKGVLKLDKSAISRRVAGALDGGFLKNLEDRKGRPARLVLGDPLPPNRDVLPLPALLSGDEGLHGCAVDQGDTPPLPPPQSEPSETIQWSARL